MDVNFVIDERTGRIIMMGALDNIVKGAAGQAVQNMNILFGLPEENRFRISTDVPIKKSEDKKVIPIKELRTSRQDKEKWIHIKYGQ